MRERHPRHGRIGKLSLVMLTLACTGVAAAQSLQTTSDANLPGLTTPSVLAAKRSDFGIQLNAFGNPDKVYRAGFSFQHGFGKGWEASVAATLAKESSLQLANDGDVDFGGSTAEVVLKYRLPMPFAASVEGGFGYSHTPAQLDRPVSLLGASFGWPVGNRVALYANPKLVALQGNSLIGLSLGGVVDVARGIRLFGDWTPLLSGENAISSVDGTRQRDSLFAVGVRFESVLPGTSLDLGYTNSIGETIGFSLTPSYGNVGGLYIALDHRF